MERHLDVALKDYFKKYKQVLILISIAKVRVLTADNFY